MLQDASTWWPLRPSLTLASIFILVLLYACYCRALPRPIPGIPYNKESSQRLWGDIPNFLALENTGRRPREFWANLSQIHKSPVSQYFPGPFAKPAVVVADFREAQDLLLRRGKMLDRGVFNNGLWSGAIPNHFIAMNSKDPRFLESRHLTKDLMTPSFLHSVSVPASYDKVEAFIDLWKFKARVASGRPFDALGDLNFLTSDIIIAAALGIDNSESDTVHNLDILQSSNFSSVSSQNNDAVFPFPELQPDGLLRCILVLAQAIGGAATAPSQSLYWMFANLKPNFRKAKRDREQILRMHIDRASQRLSGSSRDDQPHAAVDYMVSRELAAAEKAGRRPVLHSAIFYDMLFGYLMGGQDTTHSVLSFLVKQLGFHQVAQSTLRDHLRKAHSLAFAERRNPSKDEIIKTQVPFLDGFIEEVMRLDSPAPAIIKEAQCDVTILGHLVPQGTQIFFPLWGPSLDQPAFNVEDNIRSHSCQKHGHDTPNDWVASGFAPSEFHPNRWLCKDRETGETHFDIKAGPSLSFSVGSRECWGKRLAYLELRLVTTLLVWNFEFLPPPPGMVDRQVVDVLNAKPKTCIIRLKAM